tara:strand:- start:1679 stop:2353 length:675 start_codon:yes stop_codon:yes gene_type:complete
MKKKKIFFLSLFLFIFLTTFSLNNLDNNNYVIFPIKEIIIEGVKNSNKAEISKRANKFMNKSMILISKNQLNEIISDIKFIGQLKFKKIYPDKVKLIIVENVPIGILMEENKKILLNEGGEVVENFELKEFEQLPLVYGSKSEHYFHIFYKSIENLNFEMVLIKQFNYFGINRWDIYLKDGKLIKLPSNNYEKSVKEFLSIYKKKEFKNFKVFDYRINGQLILK